MKPADCRSFSEATAAANAVFEARVIVLGKTGLVSSAIDDALYKLEIAYWRRADELARKPRKRRKR